MTSRKFLNDVKFYLAATIVIVLTLLLYLPSLLLSLLFPQKVRVKGFTIMFGKEGNEIFGIGFGW